MKDQQTIALANLVTANAFRVITSLCQAGCAVTIENPHQSLLWKSSFYLKWAAKFPPKLVTLDYCMYGQPFRKRTSLATWSKRGDGSFLADLAKKQVNDDRCDAVSWLFARERAG